MVRQKVKREGHKVHSFLYGRNVRDSLSGLCPSSRNNVAINLRMEPAILTALEIVDRPISEIKLQ